MIKQTVKKYIVVWNETIVEMTAFLSSNSLMVDNMTANLL